MGGSNIDGVIIKDGRIIKTIKRPVDREDLFQSIWTTIEELLTGYDTSQIKRLNLSTTVSTNAIVENTTYPVGMIIQEGPGLHREFFACRGEKQFISGYADHRGRTVKDLTPHEITDAITSFKENGLHSCAVITKFSTRNPSHEIKINDMLTQHGFDNITLGHRISGRLNFPRRVHTSYLNAAVRHTFKDFSQHITRSLEKKGISAPVFILKADAGTMDIQTAEQRPVETILSGPAASFMGITALETLQTPDTDAILLDVGGTTTDIFFLADGIGLFEPAGAEIGEYNTLVRAIYSVSIGLGGDSSIGVENGTILIGPRREGKPYAFGGPAPTPTDAMLTLGLMDTTDQTVRDKARAAMELLHHTADAGSPATTPARTAERIAERTAELVLETMAKTIKDKTDTLLQQINARPVYTVRELLHGKTIQPTSIHIIGGPARALAPILEQHYNLPCHYPKNYHVANAIGAALARPTAEITMVADTSQGILSVPERGIHEKIPKNYSLDQAKERALQLLTDSEITEASSFNMVRGFRTTGKNIRIKAQIKPGHIQELRHGDPHES
jgi:N-methylhydantoinase A/oxoprolinase/acetone carboxylase beta subunit